VKEFGKEFAYAEEAQIRNIPLKSSPESLQIEWTARSETPITIFRLQFMANTMIDWREVDVTATRLDNGDWYGKADLANLQSETEYRVKVASLNTEGYSPFSKIHTFTTPSAGLVKQKAVSSSSSSKLSAMSSLCLVTLILSLISSDVYIN